MSSEALSSEAGHQKLKSSEVLKLKSGKLQKIVQMLLLSHLLVRRIEA